MVSAWHVTLASCLLPFLSRSWRALRYFHLSTDASSQNCSVLTNVAETLSSTGAIQQQWVFSRLNSVAYNATAGLRLTLGPVDTPPLPSTTQTASPAASSAPLILRLVNASVGSADEPNVVVFANDDDASGWSMALVLSTNKDAHKAESVWNMFNSELGDRGWKGAVYQHPQPLTSQPLSCIK